MGYEESGVTEIRVEKELALCCQINSGKRVISLGPVISSGDWNDNDTHPTGLL